MDDWLAARVQPHPAPLPLLERWTTHPEPGEVVLETIPDKVGSGARYRVKPAVVDVPAVRKAVEEFLTGVGVCWCGHVDGEHFDEVRWCMARDCNCLKFKQGPITNRCQFRWTAADGSEHRCTRDRHADDAHQDVTGGRTWSWLL